MYSVCMYVRGVFLQSHSLLGMGHTLIPIFLLLKEVTFNMSLNKVKPLFFV